MNNPTTGHRARVDLGDGLTVEQVENVPGRPLVLVEQWLPQSDPEAPAPAEPDTALILSADRAATLGATLTNIDAITRAARLERAVVSMAQRYGLSCLDQGTTDPGTAAYDRATRAAGRQFTALARLTAALRATTVTR